MNELTPVAEPLEPVAPPPSPEPEPVEESSSISDHAEQFSPESKREAEISARELANTGQFADRHPDGRRKAQSQRATPEDVAEINRLTRELRETEHRLGEKDPDAKASPRIRTLKRQIAALKALDTRSAPQPEPPQAGPAATAAPRQSVSAPGEFTDKEPTLEDFADKDDPYLALSRALAAYDRKKERFEAERQTAAQQATEQEVAVYRSHAERMQAFAAKTPDFQTVAGELMERSLPALLLQAIARDDNGPSFVYYLAQHPEVVDDLFLKTAHRPVDGDSVAAVQRLLRQMQTQAASTGSAAPARPTYSPPRPPNPVRTGPVKTSDEPPGEASSIADHAKYYDPSKRR